MGVSYKSCVSETGTLTGTDPGPYTVPNAATTPSGNQFWRTIGSAFTAATDIVLNITNSSGFEVSLWSFTPGASGAAGTITRVQLLDSSTGATINWSGATVTIECVLPPPAFQSGGTTSAGVFPVFGTNGEIDWSTLPDDFQTPSGGVTPGTPLGYTNALDTFNNGNGSEDVGALNGWENYWLFRWRGPRKITTASMVVTTAGSATYSLGIMSIGASSLTLIQTVTTGGFSDAATGVQTVSGLSFDLPQGDYVLQMVYASGSGSAGQLLMQSLRELAHGPNFGWVNGSAGWVVARGFLNNASASTLAASFSGTPGGGFFVSRAFPKIWFNGTN